MTDKISSNLLDFTSNNLFSDSNNFSNTSANKCVEKTLIYTENKKFFPEKNLKIKIYKQMEKDSLNFSKEKEKKIDKEKSTIKPISNIFDNFNSNKIIQKKFKNESSYQSKYFFKIKNLNF